MPEGRVLVIENDQDQAELLQEWLLREGYEALFCTDGKEAIRRFHEVHPALVLLDFVLPSMSGWDVLRHINEASQVPVIVVTSINGSSNVVKALSMGADDYIVVTPAERRVLLARIDAVLRRYPMKYEDHNASFRWNGLEVDLAGHRVLAQGREVRLSPIEFRLLTYLIRNAGRVVGHRELLSNVWGSNYLNGREYIKLYIRYLRLKLEKDPEYPQLITTVRGIGYCLAGGEPGPVAADPTPPKTALALLLANSFLWRIRHPFTAKARATPR
ncbi:MAG: response regulator transcription factor [Dehalococcoidia bacterium]